MFTLIATQILEHLIVSPLFLSFLCLGVFIFWLIYTAILRYHWSRYSSSKLHTLKMNITYLGGSAILFGATFLFLVLYTLSSNL